MAPKDYKLVFRKYVVILPVQKLGSILEAVVRALALVGAVPCMFGA